MTRAAQPSGPSRSGARAPRHVTLRAAAAGTGGGSSSSGEEWAALQGQTVVSCATGEEQQLTELIGATGEQRCVLAFLTQFGDFDSMEMVQVRAEARLTLGGEGGLRCGWCMPRW